MGWVFRASSALLSSSRTSLFTAFGRMLWCWTVKVLWTRIHSLLLTVMLPARSEARINGTLVSVHSRVAGKQYQVAAVGPYIKYYDLAAEVLFSQILTCMHSFNGSFEPLLCSLLHEMLGCTYDGSRCSFTQDVQKRPLYVEAQTTQLTP